MEHSAYIASCHSSRVKYDLHGLIMELIFHGQMQLAAAVLKSGCRNEFNVKEAQDMDRVRAYWWIC